MVQHRLSFGAVDLDPVHVVGQSSHCVAPGQSHVARVLDGVEKGPDCGQHGALAVASG